MKLCSKELHGDEDNGKLGILW